MAAEIGGGLGMPEGDLTKHRPKAHRVGATLPDHAYFKNKDRPCGIDRACVGGVKIE